MEEPTEEHVSGIGIGDPRESSELTSPEITSLHAFTGNDYSPALYNKGKKSPLNLLKKYDHFIDAFAALGTIEAPLHFAAIEEFICKLYTIREVNSVNMARVKLFEKWAKPKMGKSPFSQMKNVDSRLLPPCRSALMCHIARADYIARMWRGEDNVTDPPGDGWTLENNVYNITWDSKPHLPENINLDELDGVEDEELESCSSEESSDSDSD